MAVQENQSVPAGKGTWKHVLKIAKYYSSFGRKLKSVQYICCLLFASSDKI